MNDDGRYPDRRGVRRAFEGAATTYDAAAVLQHEVGERLVGRFSLIRVQSERLLDLGAGTGHTTRRLIKQFPKARITALDVAPGMLKHARAGHLPWRRPRCVCADADALPFAADSFDVVFSNLALQWVADLDRVFREVQRVLRPNGVFMFSSFGPDTLWELRAAWAAADGYTHVNQFVDMHDVGDALGRARLAEPVMDMEYFTLTYTRVRDLMRDLKRIGAHNVTGGRQRALTGKAALAAMEAAYERHRNAENRLPATWEVVYGHAWGTDVAAQVEAEPGVVRMPVAGMKIRRRGEGT